MITTEQLDAWQENHESYQWDTYDDGCQYIGDERVEDIMQKLIAEVRRLQKEVDRLQTPIENAQMFLREVGQERQHWVIAHDHSSCQMVGTMPDGWQIRIGGTHKEE